MSKYDPLSDYLFRLPEDESEHALSFQEIENILKATLPRTAVIDRPWWANTRSSIHARRWLNAGWKVGKVDFGEGSVTFVRIDNAGGESKVTRNRYQKLRRFFNNVPPLQEQIALSFSDIVSILGNDLPGTALQDRVWWANTKSSSQGTSWVSEGWKVEKVFLRASIVTFRRRGNNPVTTIPRYVKNVLEGSLHVGRPATTVLANWVRFCKRVGWYFEGTVLYEKGGLDADSLNENDRAEVDEDYNVCRRELTRHKGNNM